MDGSASEDWRNSGEREYIKRGFPFDRKNREIFERNKKIY
jgi:hypothetical protein